MAQLYRHGGFDIIETDMLEEQYRFPRSKKRRIRNKWKKNKNNWRPITNRAFKYGGKILCHPIFAAELRKIQNGNY